MRRMYSEKQLKELSKAEAKLVQKDISTLVDKDGHPRFIEGDIKYQNPVEGVTQTYGKWSLSGSHLLIVVALEYANATEVPYKTISVDLPEWVASKIYPTASQLVDYKTFSAFADDFTSQVQPAYLTKYTNSIKIELGNLTLTKDRAVRVAFDLLIDNE